MTKSLLPGHCFLDLSKAFDNLQHQQLLLYAQRLVEQLSRGFQTISEEDHEKLFYVDRYLRNFSARKEYLRTVYWDRFSSPTCNYWVVGTMSFF